MDRMEADNCETCGLQVDADAPQGLCPHCLMQAGLGWAMGAQAGASTEPEPPDEDGAGRDGVGRPSEIKRIGDYELLEELGRGGMGVVYKARQVSLNRIVAVKTILAGKFASRDAVLRFRAEAEAVASLQHPNIVAIHEIGEVEGRPYFSMDFVSGRSLAELGKLGKISPKQAAGYVQKVAHAVQCAHEHGILHRDLKPSNVLLDPQDEPQVTDFGLAKRFQGDSELTLSGQLLGSPNFMPPEQASAQHGKVSVRSDIYALGATLFFLLTGRPPFQAPTVTDTLRQVADEEPVSPHLLNPNVPADLETVCLKCLEKDPVRRYGSAGEVAEELGRFLRGEPVRARPVGLAGKLWRWGRRKPLPAGLSAAVVVLLLGLLVGSPVALLRIQGERDHARALLYDADMNLAFQALSENRLTRVRELLERHRPAPGARDLRSWEWGFLWKESESDEAWTLGGHQDAVTCGAFSADGRLLASGSRDRTIRIWDVASWSPVAELPLPNPAAKIGFTPDGRFLLASFTDGWQLDARLKLWEVGAWHATRTFTNEVGIQYWAMSGDGRFLVTTAVNGQVTLRNPNTLEPLTTLVAPYAGYKAPQGAVFASAAPVLAAPESGGIGIWNVERLEKLHTLPGNWRIVPVYSIPLALSPDGALLVVGGPQSRVLDLRGNAAPRILADTLVGVVAAVFSADGTKLATADGDSTITVWDTATWQPWGTFRGHRFPATTLAFSPDAKLVVSAGGDRVLRFWDTSTPPVKWPSHTPPQEFLGISFSSGVILYRFKDNWIQIEAGIPDVQKTRRQLPVTPVGSVHVSPQGRFLCFAGPSGAYGIWEVATMRQQATISGSHFRIPEHRAFSPDETLLLGCDETTHSRIVWRVADGREVARQQFGESSIEILVGTWGTDSRTLMVLGDREVPLWDVQRNVIRLVLSHENLVVGAVMSPDGRFIATGELGSAINLWDARQGRLLYRLGRRGAARRWTYPLAFTPDSRRLAVMGGRNGLQLYDVLTGQNIGAPRLDSFPVGGMFSRDGRWLAVGIGGRIFYLEATPFTEATPVAGRAKLPSSPRFNSGE